MAFIPLIGALDLTAEEKSSLGETADKIKDVAEFFGDAYEVIESLPFYEALTKALPWVADAADASGIPFLKFVGGQLAKALKVKDPQVLGRLACTLAYQKAAAEAFKQVGSPDGSSKTATVVKGLKGYIPSSVTDFKGLSLSNALSHQFIFESDLALIYYSGKVGYSAAQTALIQSVVHQSFVDDLRLILSEGEKFEPFRRLISLREGEDNPYAALRNHEEYQRRLFDEKRLFNTEPYALQHVYIDTDCSRLTWGAIRDGSDPFDLKLPRQPLLETVLNLITDRDLDDAIVIQGAAGAGKSSFTLKLCKELSARGFHPIRIRLRDVPLDMNLTEALPRAVLVHDPGTSVDERGSQAHTDLFLGGNLFRETISYDGFNLCPWILILDGWDEISLSAAEGFRVKVTAMLSELRQRYLQNHSPRIRVVITGRPSVDVAESHFLLHSTPVLTIRTLTPPQLELLTNSLITAFETEPLAEHAGKTGHSRNNRLDGLKSSMAYVRREYAELFARRESLSGSMEILSLPLLANLALRLARASPVSLHELLKTPTQLYRSLLDEIVWRRSRMGEGAEYLDERLAPNTTLRRKLGETAAAITLYGKENIPARELALRLKFKHTELEAWAQSSTRNHFLTELLINFFFKGGNERLGCEFMHKSFREYLYAEHIVECLKDFGSSQAKPWSERLHSEFWKDFAADTELFKLSRALGGALSAQWMSREVAGHVAALLEWEIERSARMQADAPGKASKSARPAEPLPLEKWELVRDALADLWDWWAEGVHLRRPVGEDDRGAVFLRAYVDELSENAAPRDPNVRKPGMSTIRATTVDAHLGDALFRLNVTVHYEVARQTGWLSDLPLDTTKHLEMLWREISSPTKRPRRHQTVMGRGRGREWIVFAPAGTDKSFFALYTHRINSAGWRSRFPSEIQLIGVDLRGVMLDVVGDHLRLDYCNLSNARVIAGPVDAWAVMALGLIMEWRGDLEAHSCELRGAVLSPILNTRVQSVFLNCNLHEARLRFATFAGARFELSPTTKAHFTGSNLNEAAFDRVSRPSRKPSSNA